MRFKEWLLLQEAIIVSLPGRSGTEEVPLGPSREYLKKFQFSYAYDTYYSIFEVWPFAEERPGYTHAGNARVIAIIKTSPIFPGNGADRAFLQSLTSALTSSGYKPLPYKEGDSQWMGVFKGAGADEKIMASLKAEKDSKVSEVPGMGKESLPERKTTSTISVSKKSGSWAFFIQIIAGDTDSYMREIERTMRKAMQPLIDHNLVDYYSIKRGREKEEFVWSERGKKENEDGKKSDERAVAYIKFLADKMLSNHPNAKRAVLSYFTQSWNRDVQPRDERISFDELKEYVKHHHNESPFLNFFLDAVQSDNESMYDVLEMASNMGSGFSGGNKPNMDESISAYKEISGEEYEYMMDEPRLWFTPVLRILSLSDMMTKHARTNFEKFKREYSEAINGWLSSRPSIRPGDIKYLGELAEYLDIEHKDEILDAAAKYKAKSEEESKELLRQREINDAEDAKTKQMIKKGEFKYMMIGKDSKWSDIPHKYINSHDEVDVGMMAMEEDLVDRDNLMHAAHEKASEDAWSRAEEKKSETYGKDRDEVESDIDYEWDDYMDEREFDEGEFEGMSDDQKRDKVKEDYFDDFVSWKIEKLKEEEEEESWKYEPEAEESDIRRYEEEFAEEQVYEDGLVVMKWIDDDEDEIEVSVHPKHYQKAREMVRKSVEIGMGRKDKYGEPLIRRSQRVKFLIVSDDEKIKDQDMRAMDI